MIKSKHKNKNKNAIDSESDDDPDVDASILRLSSGLSKKRTMTESWNGSCGAESSKRINATILPTDISTTSTKDVLVRNPYLKKVSSSQESSTTCTNPGSAKSTSDLLQGNPSFAVFTHAQQQQQQQRLLFQYPTLLDQGKTYPDIRAQYSIVFWKAARDLVHHSYQRRFLDQLSTKICQLVLQVEHPIRSPQEYCSSSISTTGGTALHQKVKELIALLDRYHAHRIVTPPEQGPTALSTTTTTTSRHRQGPQRRYYSIAEATLVALVDTLAPAIDAVAASAAAAVADAGLVTPQDQGLSLEQLLDNQVLHRPEHWIPLHELFPKIDQRLKSICPGSLTRTTDQDNGVAYYLDPATRSAEYQQFLKVSNAGYIKLRQKRGQPIVQLTYQGYCKAQHILYRHYPAPNGHYRTSALYQGQEPERFAGICLAMDRKEGGGEYHNLHSMCHKLDMTQIPYLVGTLSIGDYCFFRGNLLLPLLVERKSVEDVALSFADGRWHNQKKRMYQAQYVFGYEACRMAYIIEGKEDRQLVTGGYIGHRQHGVTKPMWEELVQQLESEGFDVLRTTSPENSMFQLSRWAAEILKESNEGSLPAKYTYQEFKDLVKEIPKQVDFSKLAKDAKLRRLEQTNGPCWEAGMLGKATKTLTAWTQRADLYVAQGTLVRTEQSLKGIGKSPSLQSFRSDPVRDPVQRLSSLLLPANRFLQSKSSPLLTIPSSSSRTEAFDGELGNATCTYRSETTTLPGQSVPSVTPVCGDCEYSKWSIAALKQQCTDWGLPKAGKKEELIARLKGPRPPAVLLQRRAAKQYTPERHDIGANALLVGMVLQQCPGGRIDANFQGTAKDPLYILAESLNITKNPFSGGTTQTGPYHYDGWCNMGKLMEGDPALVCRVPGRRFKLTTSGPISGVLIAKAVHRWCHEHNKCSCHELGYVYNEIDWY